MSDALTREMIEAWQTGWQAVAEIEAAERRAETMADRWQELNMLYEFALEMGLIERDRARRSESELTVYEQWGRLKESWPIQSACPRPRILSS